MVSEQAGEAPPSTAEVAYAPHMRAPEGIETPAMFLDLDVVEENIARMQRAIDRTGSVMRPHVKTHKSVRLARMQLEAGAVGITASSAGEAEVFADAGVADIFIGFTVWAAGARGRRIRDLHERVRLRVGVDSIDGAAQLAQAVHGSARRLQVVIEIDSGAGRAGVPPQQAGELASAAAGLGLDPVGVFTYAGQAGASRQAREPGAADERRSMTEAAASFESSGLPAQVVSAGTTPTALLSAGPPVTEVRPGEYLVNDADNVRLGTCSGGEDVALLVAATVVSTAVPGQVILDAGSKALGREGNPQKGFGVVPQVPGSFLRLLNEHHGYLTVPEGVRRPQLGEVVTIVPNHACPVANLFDEYVVARSSTVVGRWPVDARSHLY